MLERLLLLLLLLPRPNSMTVQAQKLKSPNPTTFHLCIQFQTRDESTMTKGRKKKTSVPAGDIPSCCSVRRFALNTLATPARVRNRVSAHCFSAVSREWCIRMLPPPPDVPLRLPPLLPLSSRRSDAWPDRPFTRSNSGNNT